MLNMQLFRMSWRIWRAVLVSSAFTSAAAMPIMKARASVSAPSLQYCTYASASASVSLMKIMLRAYAPTLRPVFSAAAWS